MADQGSVDLCKALDMLFDYNQITNVDITHGNGISESNVTYLLSETATVGEVENEYNVSNEDHGLSQERNEVLANIRFYVPVIVMPVLCLFGIGGNVLNILVLTRRRMQASMDCSMEKAAYLGLIALAVSDMLYCISALPEAFKVKERIAFQGRTFWMFYELYGKYFQNAFSSASTWLTLIMAASRYAAICHPLHAREFIRASGTIVGIVVTFIFWAAMDIPYMWTYEVSEISCSGHPHDRIYYMLDTGALNTNPKLKYTFTYLWAFLGFFIPVALLAYCNVHLIRALRESYRMRKEYRVHTRTQQPGTKITPTLIAIVVMFIILVTPSEIIQFTFFCVKSSHTDAVTTLMVIFNAMHTLNFAINFVLYCVVNVHFRSTLKDLLCCCRPKKGRRHLLKRQSLTSYTNVTIKSHGPYNQSVTESML